MKIAPDTLYFISINMWYEINPNAGQVKWYAPFNSHEWPMSDQDRISPYSKNTTSSRWVMRIKKYQLGDHKLIQYQILQTNITRTVWQTLRRVTNEILGV